MFDRALNTTLHSFSSIETAGTQIGESLMNGNAILFY